MKNSEKSSKKRFEHTNTNDSIAKRTEKAMVLETPYGNIVIHLYYNSIPIVKEVTKNALLGKYNGMTFYNRNPSFIQIIKHPNEERANPNPIFLPLKNAKGTVGLINSKKGPRQVIMNNFYICFKEIPDFDEDGTIIGKVIKGMNLIKEINNGFRIKRARIINIKKRNNLLIPLFFGMGVLFSLPCIISLLSSIFGFMRNSSFIKLVSSPASIYMIIAGSLLMLATLIIGLILRGKLSGYEEEKGQVTLEDSSYRHGLQKNSGTHEISKEPVVPDINKILGTYSRRQEYDKSKGIKGGKSSFKSPKKEKMRKSEIEESETENSESDNMFEKEEDKTTLERGTRTDQKIMRDSNTETHLDVLYNMLEKNNTLKIDSLTKTFRVSKKELLDWCNILAEHGLAEINYPTFGGPILKKKQIKKVAS